MQPLLILTYDEPNCGGASDEFLKQLDAEVTSLFPNLSSLPAAAIPNHPVVQIESFAIASESVSESALLEEKSRDGGAPSSRAATLSVHAQRIKSSLEAHLQSRSCSPVMVLSFLKDDAVKDYLDIRSVCSSYLSGAWLMPLQFHVLTNLANYSDVSLVIRTITRVSVQWLKQIKWLQNSDSQEGLAELGNQ